MRKMGERVFFIKQENRRGQKGAKKRRKPRQLDYLLFKLRVCGIVQNMHELDPWTGPKIGLKKLDSTGRRLLCERFGFVCSECYVILSVQPDMFTRFYFFLSVYVHLA